jgi:hypothetical protein
MELVAQVGHANSSRGRRFHHTDVVKNTFEKV